MIIPIGIFFAVAIIVTIGFRVPYPLDVWLTFIIATPLMLAWAEITDNLVNLWHSRR